MSAGCAILKQTGAGVTKPFQRTSGDEVQGLQLPLDRPCIAQRAFQRGNLIDTTVTLTRNPDTQRGEKILFSMSCSDFAGQTYIASQQE